MYQYLSQGGIGPNDKYRKRQQGLLFRFGQFFNCMPCEEKSVYESIECEKEVLG